MKHGGVVDQSACRQSYYTKKQGTVDLNSERKSWVRVFRGHVAVSGLPIRNNSDREGLAMIE